MRILAIQRSLPWPLASGLHLRTFHILKRLARIHDVLLGCWEGQPADAGLLPFACRVEPLPADRGLPSARDRFVARHYGWMPSSIDWLGRLINDHRPDVLFGINYQTLLALDAQRGVPSACYLGDNRWLEHIERLRRRKADWGHVTSVLWSAVMHRRYARAADAYIFVTERDAAALRRFTNSVCIGVPNGVDTEYFQPGTGPRDKRSVVFVGSLNFPPNVEAVAWFCAEIWPLVQAGIPGATLTLVGKRPVPEVAAWHNRSGIQVAGDVLDVRPYLKRAAVAVAPMRGGGGIKNKILESWATALPVVATPWSLHGLAATPGENLLVADDPADFAVEVVRLLGDPMLRQTLGQAGRDTVQRDHSWDQAASRIESCLLQIHAQPLGVG